MKTLIFALILVLGSFGSTVFAQRNVTPAIVRDPVMEADAMHNLEVAWNAFKIRKAYKGVILRFEETFAAYPEFSKIDEFLYLAGMSSYYLSDNKGNQKVDHNSEKEMEKFAPEKLREDAAVYLWTIIEKHPLSRYKTEAEQTLKLLQPGK